MLTPDKPLRRPKAEASDPGWLGLFFGQTDDRRLTVAFAFAVAIVAIVSQLFIALFDRAPQPEETVAKALVVTISAKPKPTPKPTPRPTPTPPKVRHVAVVTKPAVVATVVDPGKSAHKEVVHKQSMSRPKVVTKYHSKPIWDIPVGGQGAGAGKKGTTGSLGNGGNGSGAGGNGNGGGGGGVCGAVDFAAGSPSFDAATGLTYYDNVEMIVHYGDGHAETVTLDYPWHYRNTAMDPFRHPDVPALFQFPPKAQRASEPALVQYVMAHTTAMGDTNLRECGNIPPPPTPHP